MISRFLLQRKKGEKMVPCQIMQTQATIHKSGWEKFTDRKKKKKLQVSTPTQI